jgi:hypothetical protein
VARPLKVEDLGLCAQHVDTNGPGRLGECRLPLLDPGEHNSDELRLSELPPSWVDPDDRLGRRSAQQHHVVIRRDDDLVRPLGVAQHVGVRRASARRLIAVVADVARVDLEFPERTRNAIGKQFVEEEPDSRPGSGDDSPLPGEHPSGQEPVVKRSLEPEGRLDLFDHQVEVFGDVVDCFAGLEETGKRRCRHPCALDARSTSLDDWRGRHLSDGPPQSRHTFRAVLQRPKNRLNDGLEHSLQPPSSVEPLAQVRKERLANGRKSFTCVLVGERPAHAESLSELFNTYADLIPRHVASVKLGDDEQADQVFEVEEPTERWRDQRLVPSGPSGKRLRMDSRKSCCL